MKKYLFSTISVMIGILVLFGCKQQKSMSESGIVTFTIGSVEIQRPGKSYIPLQVKDQINVNDVIKTGENSSAVFQYSNNCVIKLDQDTIYKVLKVDENNRDFLLQKGLVVSKILRSEKIQTQIKTLTAVAAVRGTKFCVIYNNKKTRVAVSEGKIAVKAGRHDQNGKLVKNYQEEIIAEKGKTVEVSDGKQGEEKPLVVAVRSVQNDEKGYLSQIDAIPIIENVKDKTIDEIVSAIKETAQEKTEVKEEKKESDLDKLIKNRNRTTDDIYNVFNRIDEVTLYNGRVITGAIMSRGDQLTIITTTGIERVDEKDIKGARIIRQ